MAADIGAAKSEDGGRHEAENSKDQTAEERLSQSSQSMTDPLPDPPSPFIVEWVRRILPELPVRRRALDLAMGRGRHAVPLARLGLRVFGVDVSLDAVRSSKSRAAADGLEIVGWCGDLTTTALPQNAFDLIVV